MKQNEIKEYWTIRLEMVQVKKGILGFKDKQRASLSYVESEASVRIAWQWIDEFLSKRGKSLSFHRR